MGLKGIKKVERLFRKRDGSPTYILTFEKPMALRITVDFVEPLYIAKEINEDTAGVLGGEMAIDEIANEAGGLARSILESMITKYLLDKDKKK